MKKQMCICLVLLLAAGFAGCGKKKKKHQGGSVKKEMRSNVDIPVADGDIKSFFDDELGEFTLADEQAKAKVASTEANKENEFAWTEEGNEGKFKKIYFAFDNYEVSSDQQNSFEYDVAQAKKEIAEAEKTGINPVIIIEGHACHSAGSSVYNLALSEKRAKVLADRLIAAGLPRECIKIVARGKEVPAVVNGKPVTGSREEQWPNRRDEVSVLCS